MIAKIANSHVVARHSLSFVAVIVLTFTLYCVVPYVRLAIEYGPNPGPFADMSGIGFIIWGAISGPLFCIILALIGVMSEFARRFLRPRMNLLMATLLMSAAFFLVAFSVPFGLLSFTFHFESSPAVALQAATAVAPLGIVYWLVLDLSRRLFPDQA